MTDPFSQFMAGGDLPASALSWLLDTFATPFLKAIGGKWQDNRERARWDDALQSYGQSILRHYGHLRVLGKNEDVPLGSVFTDVYLLDEVSARRRFDIRELTKEPVDRFDLPRQREERRNGMGLVNQGQRLYILGKPGAGKTTFLKNVAVRAIANQLGSPTKQRLPLFVPLHEWANSRHRELLPFLVEQLDVHHFPEADDFLAHILENGNGLLLFDGLDEVRQEREQRVETARKLRDFTVKYHRCQFLITCRVAASEYAFPGLRDVEMADFTKEQILQYAQKWFGSSTQKFASFAAGLEKSENAGLAELCNVPLLLSLLCLYYDDAQAFPARRAELYEDALDALLRKWDSSRQIQRDEIYQSLSHKRKQQMFAHIATPAFEKGQLYWTTRQLADAISGYLSHLPSAPPAGEIDGEVILRAIEAQHGVLVERAHNIHSFSHLTFQEYFTARYIAENEARGTTARLAREHMTDQRWREVFLLTASLLDNADAFVTEMGTASDGLVQHVDPIREALIWSSNRSNAATNVQSDIHCRLMYFVFSQDIDVNGVTESKRMRAIAMKQDIAHILRLSSEIPTSGDFTFWGNPFDYSDFLNTIGFENETDIDFRLCYFWNLAKYFLFYGRPDRKQYVQDYPKIIRVCHKTSNLSLRANLEGNPPPIDVYDDFPWLDFVNKFGYIVRAELGMPEFGKMSQGEYWILAKYYYANELLVRCLELAYVTNRQEILDSLLRPPAAPTAPKS